MNVIKEGNILNVDIHGMRVEEAKSRLQTIIANCGADVKEIVVIHGYNKGQALKNMVRNELEAPRIKRIRAAYNAGQSVIELKKKKTQVKR